MQEQNKETGMAAGADCGPECREKLEQLRAHLAPQWGWIVLRGTLAVLFGLLAIVWPLAAVWTLALLFGAYAMADGVFSLVTAWRLHKKGVRWWPYTLFGVIGILAGALTLLWPGITVIMLMYFIAFWALFGGASQIVAAIRLRKEIQGEWRLALAGGVSVLFGLLILFRPFPEGLLALAWVVGLYAVFLGAVYIMLGFKLRRG